MVTVEPAEHVPEIVVLGVRWTIQWCVPSCTFICLLSHEQTVPAIVSVCPNAIPLNMHPATIAHVNIFTFMVQLEREIQRDCKLLLRRSLGLNFGVAATVLSGFGSALDLE